MKTEIIESKEITTMVTRQKVIDYLRAFGLSSQLTEQEAEQFINIAQEFQLNPFKREIHCIPYGDGANRKIVIVVGYETYIKRAERTGMLDGWSAITEGEGEGLKAVVEIHRKDWQMPFRHEVTWAEAVQRKRDGSLMPFWQQRPHTMLKKTCISQAFRLTFTSELGGLPYDPCELGINQDQIPSAPMVNVTPSKETPESVPSAQLAEPPPKAPAPLVIGKTGQSAPSMETEPLAQANDYQALERYLDEQQDCFTPNHLEWIRNQVDIYHTPEKAAQMLRYAQRCVREHDETAAGNPANLKRLRQFNTSPINRSTV